MIFLRSGLLLRRFAVAALVTAATMAPGALWAQCVSIASTGTALTQNFDGLANTGTSSTTPSGWFFSETGTAANTLYNSGTGSLATGDTYSFGAALSTERAFGGLQSGTLIPTIGACYTNNTGANITSLDIQYFGEQWRVGAASRADRIDFQYSTDATSLTTGTWSDVNTLDFSGPLDAAVGAKNGNDGTHHLQVGPVSIPSLTIANGATFWIRWTDFNATGADDGLAVDDFSLTATGAPPTATLSINDVTVTEGNSGTVTANFTVSLSLPAGLTGVTFDIATADNSATTANNDYVARSLVGQTITAGNTTYAFSVTVNGDTSVEPNETFFVNVTNVANATLGDGLGIGTITNDDFVITPIHDIQGSGSTSPIVGANVTTTGVVTGVKTNGFFLQEPSFSEDANPLTSEGIFVFTSGAPPVSAAVGNLVQVTGTVAEFVPSQDPLQPPVTELTSPTVTLISPGNPLPTPYVLTDTLPDPAGAHDQLERYEGMRVRVFSLRVVAPSGGNISEANSTATSDGAFYGVIGNVIPRPFREAGIQAPDPAPAGSIPPIPRFDSNPERIRVDSDGLVGATALNVTTGAVLTDVIGPLDYGFRTYTILPDPALPPTVSGGMTPTSVADAAANQVTIGSANLRRFYDTVNDPGTSDVVLTGTAFNLRLEKTSLAIRNNLKMPDIVAVQEMENLTTLQTLATRISTDAVAASQPDPQYVAHLIEGNDVGGIDVGYLVKTSIVTGSTPRVSVISVVQENAGELFTNADLSTELLNDRPTLRMRAVVNFAGGQTYPVTILNVHLRSLNGSADTSPGSSGWATVGDRVRAKRQKQAESLANTIQGRQVADPTENILVVGDFNALSVNDGLGHSMGVISGNPVPDNQTAVPGDGVDLVSPNLLNLSDDIANPSERYSYSFGGNAQTLDHVLGSITVYEGLGVSVEHPRINADFDEVKTGLAASPLRISDHDPTVAFINAFEMADMAITKNASADPVPAGNQLQYTLQVSNNGPNAASNAEWSDTLPLGTTFESMAALPPGWSCTTPVNFFHGTITCTNPSFGSGEFVFFTVTVNTNPLATPGTLLSNTATTSSDTFDPNLGDNTATNIVTYSCPVITVNPNVLPNGHVGTAYTPTVTAVGGVGPYTFTVSPGLPPGVSLSPAGVFSGTPTTAGTYSFTITVTDHNLCQGSTNYTVHVGSVIAPGDLVIREFRWRGPNGVQDEYVEVMNRGAFPLTVVADDASSGYGVFVEGQVAPIFSIPNGTVLRPGGFYLGANCGTFVGEICTGGYSLYTYGTPDRTWFGRDVADDKGIAIRTSTTDETSGTLLDAVGFTTSPPTFKEGTGLTPSDTGTAQASYHRMMPYGASGQVKDTGNNASDFYLADTQAGTFGSVVARLGAPGPQNSFQDEQMSGLTFALADPTKGQTTFPNRFRVGTTYYFRWKITNNTGAAITSLRIRVADVTTLNSPGYSNPLQADFRFVPTPNSASFTVPVDGLVVAQGLTLEAPSGLPNDGGYNASAVVTTLPGGVLANGASVYVNVGFRYPRGGSYYYWVWAEGKP